MTNGDKIREMSDDSWDCRFEFTSLGTSPKSIRLSLGAADVDSENPTHIIPRVNVKVSDAADLWWVGDRADGGMVAVKLKRALSTAGFSLQTTKAGKGNTSVTLTGHTTIDTQDEVPMEFWSSGPVLGKLTVQSQAGTDESHTKLTVEPAKANGNAYFYKSDADAQKVTYGQEIKDWTSWDGAAEVETSAEQTITVVECDPDSKAVKMGTCTATVGGE